VLLVNPKVVVDPVKLNAIGDVVEPNPTVE